MPFLFASLIFYFILYSHQRDVRRFEAATRNQGEGLVVLRGKLHGPTDRIAPSGQRAIAYSGTILRRVGKSNRTLHSIDSVEGLTFEGPHGESFSLDSLFFGPTTDAPAPAGTPAPETTRVPLATKSRTSVKLHTSVSRRLDSIPELAWQGAPREVYASGAGAWYDESAWVDGAAATLIGCRFRSENGAVIRPCAKGENDFDGLHSDTPRQIISNEVGNLETSGFGGMWITILLFTVGVLASSGGAVANARGNNQSTRGNQAPSTSENAGNDSERGRDA